VNNKNNKTYRLLRFSLLISVLLLRGGNSYAQSDSIKILWAQSREALNKENAELGINTAKMALDKAMSAQNHTSESAAYDIGESARLLGGAYRADGKMDKAVEFFSMAVRAFEKTNFYERHARSLTELGRVKQGQRNFAEAVELYTQALTIYNKKLTPDESAKHLDLKALILERMALLLAYQKQYDQAETYAVEAFELCEKVGEKGRWEITSTTTGNIYFWKEDYEKAAFYYQKSHSLAQDIGRNTGRTLNNLGIVASKSGKLDKAIEYYLQAIEQYQKTTNRDLIAQMQINIGEIYNEKGDFKKAIQYSKQGIEALIRLKSLTGLVEGYENLITAYMKSGELNEALDFQKRFTVLKDSLHASSRQKELLEFQTKFETERKDKEIKLLNNENALRDLQLQQKNLDLTNQKLLTEKNQKTLALLQQTKILQESELARTSAELEKEKQIGENTNTQLSLYQKDIKIKEQEAIVQSKNNAILRGSILGLVAFVFAGWWLLNYLQNLKEEREAVAKARAVETAQRQWQENELRALRSQMNPHFIFNCLNSIKSLTLKNETDKASIYITKFSRLMRQVLESSRNEWISLKDEIENLSLYMDLEKLRFQDKFTYQLDIEQGLNTHALQVPPMLIQPYVENAIWHGLMHKKEGGHVVVSIAEKETNILEINVIDDGIGRKSSFDLKSKSANEQKSFGMQINAERMTILNQYYQFSATSTITDLYDELGNATGTKVCLKIPI
jgi:tetratricopeptide (TPR) repeat protein